MSEKIGRLLVIDDEKDNLNAITRLLRKDFHIVACEGGIEALKLLDRDRAFDVILSDQRMPDMTGSELFERVQNVDPLSTRSLISGFSDLEAVIDAVNRGHIWKYIAKPWEPDELRQILKDAVERSQLKREVERSRNQLHQTALELRARDWSRERLLSVLLHEFRSIPQVIENVIEMNSEHGLADDRKRFLGNLNERVRILKDDVESLLEDEKQVSQMPRKSVDLKALIERLFPSHDLQVDGNEASFERQSCEVPLSEGLKHLIGLLESNTQNAPCLFKN